MIPNQPVNNWLSQARKHELPVCVFGLGVLTRETFPQLVHYLGKRPEYVCDNDASKWGESFYDLPCIAPETLKQAAPGAVVIIAVKQYEDILRQLHQLGFEKIMVINFDRGYHLRQIFVPVDLECAVQPVEPINLRGKWAFVSGSSRGIGQRIALELAERGVNLILHARQKIHCQETQHKCRHKGVDTAVVSAELSDLGAVDALMHHMVSRFPPVEIIVNNAAISPSYTGEVWPVESAGDIQRILTINTMAPIRIIQHLMPPMLQTGFGRIMNVTSNIQFRPMEMMYTVSKGALDTYTREISHFLKDRKSDLSMTMVDPGWIKTKAGGPDAIHEIDTIMPGILLGILLGSEFHGHRFNAQDFRGMDMQRALGKAHRHLYDYTFGEWI